MEQQRTELLVQHTDLLKHWEATYRSKINKLLEEKTHRLLEIQKQFFEKLNEINDASTTRAIISSGSSSGSIARAPIPSNTKLATASNLTLADIKSDMSNIPSISVPDLPPISFILQEAINSINANNTSHNHNSTNNALTLNSFLNQNHNSLSSLKSEFDLQSLLDTNTTASIANIAPPVFVPPSVQAKDIKIKWPCTHCKAVFISSDELITHLATHSLGTVEGHPCKQCGKILKSKNNLKRHMRTHTGDKPYVCDMCGKAFAQSGTLTVHKRSHTGEKPYECKECGRAFATFNTLKNHARTHTGEKPFQCQFCLKKFTQLGSLNTHIRCYCKEKHD
eukprot:282507_1